MNERIKELELQVAQSFDPLHRLSQQEYTTEFNKRFAELIVRECSDIAMNHLDCPASAIEEHFGV